jgi:uncharacterized FlaG/YvyC family protein
VHDYVPAVGPTKGKNPTTSAPHADQAALRPVSQDPDSSDQLTATRSASQTQAPEKKPLSLEELQEMLRKINLTFDLFEIAAEYTIDKEANRVKVVVRNTRTGKVIRRIPPEAFAAEFYDLKRGLGLRINASV